MKDSGILLITATLMVSLMLAGQFLRGDFVKITDAYTAVNTETQIAAVEQDGRALIDVNLADAQTLRMVDGLGETLSQRIVDYREEHGFFHSVDELLDVKGVGVATLERISDRLTCVVPD